MFLSVPEDNTADNETPDVTDRQLPKHLEDAFHIARKMVDPSGLHACTVSWRTDCEESDKQCGEVFVLH